LLAEEAFAMEATGISILGKVFRAVSPIAFSAKLGRVYFCRATRVSTEVLWIFLGFRRSRLAQDELSYLT
jgi:hypothetical protein